MDVITRAKHCLDTYALVALFQGDGKYKDLLRTPFVVPDPVLAELYDMLLRKHDKTTADYWYKRCASYGVPVPQALLVQAVDLRRKNKKLRLSFTDAAGYCLARHLGIPFVTGDKAFKGLAGVDFRPAQQAL